LQGFSAAVPRPVEPVALPLSGSPIESVQTPRYSSEHMFDCLWIAEPNEQGAD
jgi:hypothetical protein